MRGASASATLPTTCDHKWSVAYVSFHSSYGKAGQRSSGIIASLVQRRRGSMAEQSCAHLAAVQTVKPAKARQCDECVKTGASWVHLRTCQTCGLTHCCDSSPNRHASKHARATEHPVIA